MLGTGSRDYVMYCGTTKARDEWEYVLRKTIRSSMMPRRGVEKEGKGGGPSAITTSKATKGIKLYQLSLTKLSRTYTLPGSRLRQIRLIERVDASQLQELKNQSKKATMKFDDVATLLAKDVGRGSGGGDGAASSDEEEEEEEEEGEEGKNKSADDDDDDDDDEEEESQNKKETETTTMATPMTIPTLSRLRDVSGRLVRRASSLLQEILELNMMAQQVGLNQEEIIQTRLSSLRSELESLVELQNTLKKIGQEHSETMSQLRDDSACL